MHYNDHRRDRRKCRFPRFVVFCELCEFFVGGKFQYEIVGHSGESGEIPLVEFGKPPVTTKEKVMLLEKMIAHSQYCATGDSTVEATRQAVREVLPSLFHLIFSFLFSFPPLFPSSFPFLLLLHLFFSFHSPSSALSPSFLIFFYRFLV